MSDDHIENLPGMVGRHPKMLEVYDLVWRAAAFDHPVCVVGETGTGKELIARALHALGPRAAGPFVDVNCAAIPPALAEAELFGAVRGAFTGADRAREGLVLAADGGTLFLDELSSMPMGVQGKLLRVLETAEVRPVGATRKARVRVRLVAAACAPPVELVRTGRLRQDLAHRLAVVVISLPPLRERRGDVVPLAYHFLAASGNGRRLDGRAVAALDQYGWPGNVRELRTVVARLLLLTDGSEITAPDVAAALTMGEVQGASAPRDLAELVAEAGSIAAAARRLGVSRSTVRRRLASLAAHSAARSSLV